MESSFLHRVAAATEDVMAMEAVTATADAAMEARKAMSVTAVKKVTNAIAVKRATNAAAARTDEA